MSDLETKVLNKVKGTLKKITFFHDNEETKTYNKLVIMNIPPLMARRDAAYDKVVSLLHTSVFTLSEEERYILYSKILELLEIAINATSCIPDFKKRKYAAGAILQYLLLLKNTVKAAHGLVNHEVLLLKEEKELSEFIGHDVSSQFFSTDEIFNTSELNIYQCILDLTNIAAPAITRYREFKKKQFSKSEQARYNKAYREYSTLYNKINITQEDYERKK